jgi:hypothetical protein
LKGGAYLSTFRFIHEKYGADAKQRVLERLTPEDRALVGGIMLPIVWYPLAPFPRLLRAMDEELGKGDLKLATERGVWTAINDMKTVHRVLLKVLTTQWVINSGMRLWPNFHTTGRWESVSEGSRRARASLHDLGVVDEALCATLKGWIIGLLQLAGAEPTVTHEECRARGASACVYNCSWR